MNDEQIKEITIAMINKGNVYPGRDNVITAKELASFINTLKQELNNGGASCDDIPIITTD